VANLLLKEAERTGRRIRIMEWPAGVPIRNRVPVAEAIQKGIIRGSIVNVRLSSSRSAESECDIGGPTKIKHFRQKIAGGYLLVPKAQLQRCTQSFLRVDARGCARRFDLFVCGCCFRRSTNQPAIPHRRACAKQKEILFMSGTTNWRTTAGMKATF
jgi:hypothetical protein